MSIKPNSSTKILFSLILLGVILTIYSYHIQVYWDGTALKSPKIKEFFSSSTNVKKSNQKDTNSKSIILLNDSTKIIKDSSKPSINNLISRLKDLKPHTLDTSNQRILMIGESMIEQLYLAFLKYGKYNHHEVKAKIWYGSRFIEWSQNDTITKLIQLYKPTYIIVSIGANELYLPKICERRPELLKILAQLKGQNFIWIGPPIPKKDFGIDSMIANAVGEDRYFRSKYMTFQRRRDGVHPKPESARKWADSIAVWIMDKSRYPIRMIKPVKDSTTALVPLPKSIIQKSKLHKRKK